jgi:hypothetical protein
MLDGGTKLPATLAIASEGALTLIGASLDRLVFRRSCGAVDALCRRRPLTALPRHCRALRQGLLPEPTAVAQVGRRELVILPHNGPLHATPVRAHRIYESGGVVLLGLQHVVAKRGSRGLAAECERRPSCAAAAQVHRIAQ